VQICLRYCIIAQTSLVVACDLITNCIPNVKSMEVKLDLMSDFKEAEKYLHIHEITAKSQN